MNKPCWPTPLAELSVMSVLPAIILWPNRSTLAPGFNTHWPHWLWESWKKKIQIPDPDRHTMQDRHGEAMREHRLNVIIISLHWYYFLMLFMIVIQNNIIRSIRNFIKTAFLTANLFWGKYGSLSVFVLSLFLSRNTLTIKEHTIRLTFRLYIIALILLFHIVYCYFY